MDNLTAMKHSTGVPLARIYGPTSTEDRGGAVTVNFVDPTGQAIDHRTIETEAGKKARTIEVACKGCGTCGATCYRGAITMKHYSNDQLVAQIRAAFVRE